MKSIRFAFTGLLALALAIPALAQRPSFFAGQYSARAFAYGINQSVAPLQVAIGTAAGVGTITLNMGNIVTPDGITFMPLSTNAPITIGSGATSETQTPSAVSCTTPTTYQTCQVTANWTNTHGTGDLVSSGTVGLQEAINYAHAQGGGNIDISAQWASLGGTNALIAAATPYSNVIIEDNRATTQTYWGMQPSTATLLAAPTTLTATTVTWTTTGTWTAADHFLCITYVDALGGEGPCSATYDVTPAATTIANIASPAASAGAVGWRAYAGSAYATAYLLPITSTNCTLTTLESVFPACAIGAAGTWPAIWVNTAIQKPAAATPVAASNNPVKQGHTLFAYFPMASQPIPFQAHYGPFPAMSGGTTAAQAAYLGSFELPTGYLAQLGRTIRITGKINITTDTATTPSILVKLGWAGGTTTGAPVAVCTATSTTAYGSSAVFYHSFSCTMTTTTVAVGATSAIQSNSWAIKVLAGGTAVGTVVGDALAGPSGSLNLALQNTVYIEYIGSTSTTSSLQLMDLHVETLL